MREGRSVVRQAGALLRSARGLLDAQAVASADVKAAAAASAEQSVLAAMAAMPLESLRGSLPGRVAWSALADAGYGSVADARRATFAELVACEGVGEQSARAVKEAADAVFAELLASARPRIDVEVGDAGSRALVRALVHLDGIGERFRRELPVAQEACAALPELIARARPASAWWRWMFTGAERRADALDAVGALHSAVQGPAGALTSVDAKVLASPAAAGAGVNVSATADAAWVAFCAEPARYLSLLDAQVGGVAVSGELDAELLARIDAVVLDRSALRVMLRRYQDFGARFAIAQERVLLGDEMGLGKSVQALAVMAHLWAQGALDGGGSDVRFLVVAPASVLINWEREATSKTDLPVVVLHGSRDPGAAAAWKANGGIAITTYEYLATLALPSTMRLDLLVVDEAHYVKNPQAQRSGRVAALAARASRVLLMTGTPIENYGEEFVELVRLLDPAIAGRLHAYSALVSPEEFRRRVAPVYVRRNSDDVLTELPALIEIDEWEELTDHDAQHYRQAVASGNFMAMRRAGFGAAGLRQSAKLERLQEIVAEARMGGHRVIVYSYFLEVLDAVVAGLGGGGSVAHGSVVHGPEVLGPEVLGPVVLGPLTGALTPRARQGLVDAFGSAPAGSVLVAQIVAGGIGLNIQSASVVVLCEPQLKPST